MRLYLPTGQRGEADHPQASQPPPPRPPHPRHLGMTPAWAWGTLAYYGTSWPLPVPPTHRYHPLVIPLLPLAEAW